MIALRCWKQKQIFDRRITERCGEIENLSREIDYKDLTDHFKTKGNSPQNFNGFEYPLIFLRKKRDGEIKLEEAKNIKESLNQI